MTAADIASIERATLEAVAPQRLESLPGWLLPMDGGTVGRAKSAVPLAHDWQAPAVADTIAARYQAQGFVPAFRLPDRVPFTDLQARLGLLGFVREQPTLTQVGPLGGLLRLSDAPPCAVDTTPDAGWMDMYLGEGLDPVDGASRAAALARAPGLLYLSVREGGQTVACGAASLGQGWLGVHGMRTAASQRGRGLAARVLRTMAQEALSRGLERVFLQVMADNTAALALYQKAGLRTAWPYAYWRLPGA